MSRSTLISVVVVLIVVGIAGYFFTKSDTTNGIVNLGKESGPPTESEVSALIKSAYESCIPVNVWQEKSSSLGGNAFDMHPCTKMTMTGGTTIQACEDWIKGKYECGLGTRYVEADNFVSFKKTDGKSTAPSQYQPSEYYTMYGVLTTFQSGKDIEQKVQINFERRESGWVLPSDNFLVNSWSQYNDAVPLLEIPR